MFVVLEYDRPGAAPIVLWGEVYTDRDDANAAAQEQDFTCRSAGKPWKHEVASLVAA